MGQPAELPMLPRRAIAIAALVFVSANAGCHKWHTLKERTTNMTRFFSTSYDDPQANEKMARAEQLFQAPLTSICSGSSFYPQPARACPNITSVPGRSSFPSANVARSSPTSLWIPGGDDGQSRACSDHPWRAGSVRPLSRR